MKPLSVVTILLSLLAGFFPRLVDAQVAPPPLESLPPCNFNAYTERDDLIIGAVVLHLGRGDGCMQNLNTVFPFASVGKLFIAGALYEKVAQGEIYFETELTFTSDYLMNGQSDCLTPEMVGQKFTVGYLGNVMISCSDNPATWMLMDYIGWGAVSAYIAKLNIPDIGEVLPYSYVDRMKLLYLDDAWENVPVALASQYYRRRSADGLVPQYFRAMPFYSEDDFREINARYLEESPYNTATPRAIATYLFKLVTDMQQRPDTIEGRTALWIFNTMLLTQRVFSTQYMPGNVIVGSKNGFDVGYRAEVNITISSLENRLPETISVLVVRHRDIRDSSVPYRFRNVPTTDLLLAIAPKLSALLYPESNFDAAPFVNRVENVRLVTFNTEREMLGCWQDYLGTDYLNVLQPCWNNLEQISRMNRSDWLGVGLVLRYLNGQDARITLIYTLPDGSKRSYQMQRFFEDATAVAWFEEVAIPGLWRVDVFFNLVPVFTRTVRVE